jgi:hypothetical protein
LRVYLYLYLAIFSDFFFKQGKSGTPSICRRFVWTRDEAKIAMVYVIN